MEYKNQLLEHIQRLTQSQSEGHILTTEWVTLGLDPNGDNTLIRDWAIKNTKVTKSDFDAELRKIRIRDELGSVPRHVEEFLDLYVKREQIHTKYNGELTRNKDPHIFCEVTGQKLVYDAEARKDPIVEEWYSFVYRPELTLVDLGRDLRLVNDRLRLGYSDRSIEDSLVAWYARARNERLYHLFGAVAFIERQHRQRADALWIEVAQRVFDLSEDPAEYVAAVLKKFMWQAKRKMRSLPVTNHLMPVLLGPQGIGKSTFVHQMTAALGEVMLETDFGMIEDERNHEIWDAFILFLDEMHNASKADMDAIKHAITASTLTRRPMRSNNKVQIRQNATFIGCSNKELAQLIRDPTGIRRFVGLRLLANPDWSFINSIDWVLLWKSVDHRADDPMIAFQDHLKRRQAEDWELGRVEAWLQQFHPTQSHGTRSYGEIARNNVAQAEDLYHVFREFEDAYYPGWQKTAKPQWDHEMNRLYKSYRHLVPFKKGRNGQGVTWSYEGQAPVLSFAKAEQAR